MRAGVSANSGKGRYPQFQRGLKNQGCARRDPCHVFGANLQGVASRNGLDILGQPSTTDSLQDYLGGGVEPSIPLLLEAKPREEIVRDSTL